MNAISWRLYGDRSIKSARLGRNRKTFFVEFATMKRALLLAFTLAASITFAAHASEGFDDLVKLAKSGVSEQVLLAYVESSANPYALTVDEILYLNDIGVPNSFVAAAIRRNDPNKVAAAPADSPL